MTARQALPFHHFKELTSVRQNLARGAGDPQDEPQSASAEPLDGEQRDALEQWLRQIPDDPGELLRRKFLYEQQQRQERSR